MSSLQEVCLSTGVSLGIQLPRIAVVRRTMSINNLGHTLTLGGWAELREVERAREFCRERVFASRGGSGHSQVLET